MPRKKKPSERQDVFEKLDAIELTRLPDGVKWEGFKNGDPRVQWKKVHGNNWENIKLMDLMFENNEIEILEAEAKRIESKIRRLKRIENAKAIVDSTRMLNKYVD